MWPSRIAILLAEPPEFLALATDPRDERVWTGKYLHLDDAPYALGRRVARGDEAIVFELVDLRLGYCAGVVKICRYKPGTERYGDWAVPQREERNPHSHLPDVELYPARLVAVPGGVVKVQQYMTPEPETAWATHGPIYDVLAYLEEGRSGEALRLADTLLEREGRHGVLLEAKGLALDRLERLDEAQGVLEDALEAHLEEGNAARLHTAYVLASVLHKLYEPSAGMGGSTLSLELSDGMIHTQTMFASVEDAAADDSLEDRAVFVLLEALGDEPYFAGGLLKLGGYIVNAPAGIDTVRTIVTALQRIDPADPDVVAFAAFVEERYGAPHPPAWEAVNTPAAVHELTERFDALYRPEPMRARQAAARYDAARVHIASGQFALAERELREAVDLDPDEVDYRLVLADVLEWENKHDETKRVLEEAESRFPDNASVYEALGDLCSSHEEHTDAKLAYLRALATNPDEPWRVEVKVGVAYHALDEDERALEFLRTAQAHAPDEPAPIVALVQVLRAPALRADGVPGDDERFREAFAIVNDAVRRLPPDAPLFVCAAQSLFALGRYAEGREALRRAVKLDPDHPFAARFLSDVEEGESCR